MIRFTYKDKKYELPTSWDEVTVNHFIKPEFLSGNALSLLSAISGMPVKELAYVTEDVAKRFEETVSFMNEDPDGWKGEHKEEIDFMGKRCKIPRDLELETFGQKVMFGQALGKYSFIYAAIPEAIAIYLGPQVFEEWYKPDLMEKMTEAVRAMPIHEVFPIASFFLRTSSVLRQSGRKE